MDTTNTNLSLPASQLTKLEYVAAELFAKRLANRGTLVNQEGLDTIRDWAINVAASFLYATDEYHAERSTDSPSRVDAMTRIGKLGNDKKIRTEDIARICQDRYGQRQYALLTDVQIYDLAKYLENA